MDGTLKILIQGNVLGQDKNYSVHTNLEISRNEKYSWFLNVSQEPRCFRFPLLNNFRIFQDISMIKKTSLLLKPKAKIKTHTQHSNPKKYSANTKF